MGFELAFKNELSKLITNRALNIGIAISEALLPDYQGFSTKEGWGDVSALHDGITACKRARDVAIPQADLAILIDKVDQATPDMDDFGTIESSYALNAATVVSETLQFLRDRDIQHIVDAATFYADTVDFRIHEEAETEDSAIAMHPTMREAQSWLMNLTSSEN